ncbi:MAG: channel protein TolC [Burkholderiales bacterium 35-55-47]|jgi:outer membrane protein|uniref:TolC family outer membrane protein n=1 Tax=Limnohabitans sp. TaxID=1907725 RepID=UPI000BD43144|nr:TolC family outer membrane protein [Limnohabitans sp.]OYY19992.1 MAG: channel protein TolC [Burkholderiales bacterium 35-55-47]OYZ74398.1 MAG: channel protein TolC [Burkholderiales bacterium 24-55-52]OZB01711.1 MAG: channel protein TolC [Burkholderiales bacterium 39-55-53]HQR86211.1 TolC family outer membrane protein [Limnohabitans sp.]HQS25872.1 TolC family outer membrane protein [Limnohabitans sp.]
MSLTRTVFRTLPVTAAVMLAFASSAQAQSLVEMYEAARGYDAGFISAKAQFEANLARANQSLGGILPNIAVSVSQVRTDFQRQSQGTEKSAITELETKTTAATLTQPIYRPAAWASYRQGGRQLQQAAAQYEAAEHDLLIRVSQAYFDVLTSEDNFELVQNQKKAVSEQLASAQRNFEVGTATITGVRDAQARYDLTNAQAIAAENDLRTKRLALNMVVGLSDAKPKRLAKNTTLVTAPKEDVNAWVSQAHSNSPAVRQAQLAVEVADYEMDKAIALHKPTLDAQMTYGRTENLKGSFIGTTLVGPSTTWNPSVGLVLNVPLFTGFSGVYKVKEAYALKDKAQSDLENARRGTEQATRNTYFGLLAGLSQVKAYEAAEASSQSALDANKLGYSVGVNINIDVLNSQSQLYQTKRDLAKARYDVLVTNLKLRQAAGTLTPADLQPINDLLAP